jgi:hypothetical protein
MAAVVNRLGFRLRQVVKAQPQKKLKATDAIFAHLKTRRPTPRPREGANACASMVKRRCPLGSWRAAVGLGALTKRAITTAVAGKSIPRVASSMKTAGSCLFPVAVPTRPVIFLLRRSKPRGKPGTRQRRPRESCDRAKWIMDLTVMGCVRSFCIVWCSVRTTLASPCSDCLIRPSRAHSIRLRGAGVFGRCMGTGRRWSMWRRGWHGPRA